MKIKAILSLALILAMLFTAVACNSDETGSDAPVPDDPTPNTSTSDTPSTDTPNINTELDIPDEYLKIMTDLLNTWGVRKGSLSDPLIGTKMLMYEKTKDEVGFILEDLDGNGIKELITAPFDEYASNGMVYDIVTIKDGKAFHLANSLEATYHFCDDNTFILRKPNADKTYSFKNVVIIGDEKPIETDITKEESATYVLSQIKLTPFSALEK